MVDDNKIVAATKGTICVTGGTGFLGSWMVKRLLEDGYSVHATVRMNPERKRDISYLTNLPGASERLKILNADLDNPESFAFAIEGCTGVFHMAHPLDFEEKESEETKIKRTTIAMHGILQACVDSKTVKRVVYTSSISAAALSGEESIDESSWTNVDLVRSFKAFGGPYIVTKTLVEKAALEFAEKNGLDLVSILPTWTTGPFLCPNIPDSVYVSLALIIDLGGLEMPVPLFKINLVNFLNGAGDKNHYQHLKSTCLVHVDDVARAHIHLFESPEAKGRYLCTGVEFTIEELCEFLSKRYPEYEMPTADSWKDLIPLKFLGIPSTKLLETGFKYENRLEEMFDGAIKCCKEKGVL